MQKDPTYLSALGLKLTKLYLIALATALPVGMLFGWIKIAPISLNEIGDLLAGIFGPIAFLWLVLGFLLQSKELKNSVDALKLQAEELRNSVEQQKELVEVTRSSLQAEINNRKSIEQRRRNELAPLFIINVSRRLWRNGQSTFRLTITNVGASVRNVVVSCSPPLAKLDTFSVPLLKNGANVESEFIVPDDLNSFLVPLDKRIDERHTIVVNYEDQESYPDQKAYAVSPVDKSSAIITVQNPILSE